MFDWRAVLGSLHGADLSDAMRDGKVNHDDRQPMWPSERYEREFKALKKAILAHPRDMTVAGIEAAVDSLFEELSKGEALDPVTDQHWEEAANALLETKKRAQDTLQTRPAWMP